MKKIISIIIINLILLIGTTSLAGTDYYTINSVLNEYGYGDMPVNANVTTALNQNNVAVFFTNYNADNEPTRVTIMYDQYSFFPIYLQLQGSGSNMYYRIYAANNTRWLYYHYYNINTTTKELTYGGSVSSNAYPTMTTYSNYSTTASTSEFQTYAFQKKILKDSYIYTNKGKLLNFGSTSGTNIYYKWNGVWDGTNEGLAVDYFGGSFTFEGDYLKYYYDSDLNAPINFTVELCGYYPGSLKSIDKDTIPDSAYADYYNVMYVSENYEYNYYNVRLHNLISKMEDGMIYRMNATAYYVNESGEQTTHVCTSEFFSLNNWTSDYYIIRNLLNYVSNPDLVPDDNSSGTEDEEENEDFIYIENGITSGELNESIGNIETNESGDVIGGTGLVGNIFKSIETALKNFFNTITDFLFAIDEEFVNDTINLFLEDTKDQMGLFSLNNYILQKTCSIFMTDTNEDFKLNWDSIKYQDIQIIPAGEINFSKVVESNEIFKTLYNYYIIIISCVWIYLFASWLREIVLQLFGFNWIGHNLNEEYEISSQFQDIDTETGEVKETFQIVKRKGNHTKVRRYH